MAEWKHRLRMYTGWPGAWADKRDVAITDIEFCVAVSQAYVQAGCPVPSIIKSIHGSAARVLRMANAKIRRDG